MRYRKDKDHPASVVEIAETIVREPIHRQINRILKKELTEYRPGQKIPSEHNLALRFGVSVMTVRQAIAGLVNEGLLTRRRGSGTYVAKPTHFRRVGVLVEQRLEASGISHFYFQLVRHLHLLSQERGYDCRLYIGDTAAGEDAPESAARRRFLADLERGEVHGLLALATSSDVTSLKRVADVGFPVVGGYHKDLPYCVQLNKEEMMAKAVSWLTARGRKRLGLLAIGEDDGEAFKRILAQQDLVHEPQWIVACSHPRENILVGEEGFLRLWRAKEMHPDGLVIMDDVLCAEAIPAILKEGVRVPEELLIVSHANKGVAWPALLPIARMEVDPRLWAEALLDTLSQIWEDRTMVPHVRYVPFVVKAETENATAVVADSSPLAAKSTSRGASRPRKGRRPSVASAARTAFTLVELLVVMAIISILAAMLFPVLHSVIREARVAACASNEKQIGLAIQYYAADNYQWLPPSYHGPGGGTCAQGNRVANDWYPSRLGLLIKLGLLGKAEFEPPPGQTFVKPIYEAAPVLMCPGREVPTRDTYWSRVLCSYSYCMPFTDWYAQSSFTFKVHARALENVRSIEGDSFPGMTYKPYNAWVACANAAGGNSVCEGFVAHIGENYIRPSSPRTPHNNRGVCILRYDSSVRFLRRPAGGWGYYSWDPPAPMFEVGNTFASDPFWMNHAHKE